MSLIGHKDRVRLTNARIVDVEGGSYADRGTTLIIEGGRIAAMPAVGSSTPADVEIDLQGKTLIPGLFNTHCHLQFIMETGEARERQIAFHLADCLERGVTNIRDTLCFDLRLNRPWIENVASGSLPGPRIHQAIHVGPLDDTYAPRNTLKSRFLLSLLGLPLVRYDSADAGVVVFQRDAPAQEVRDAVDRAIDERGAAAIKFCDQPEKFITYQPGAAVITPEQLTVAVDQARRRGCPTTMHNVTVTGLRHATRAGVDSLAHLPIDGLLSEDDAAGLSDARIYLEPTLTVGYYMCYDIKGSPFAGHPEISRLHALRDATYGDYVAASWLPERREVHMAQHTTLKTGEMKLYGFIDLSPPFRYMTPTIPIGGENLRHLVRCGALARLATGTDAGPANISPAIVELELRLFDFILNRDGSPIFTPADALRAATLHSARAMGLDDDFGDIRTGKVADLAVIDGDPFADPTLIGSPVEALFMDGQLVVNRCGLVTSAY
jgi:imidazolonepropionase-like amidohydrolase